MVEESYLKKEPRPSMEKMIVDIKNHVIQLEILSLITILLITLVSIRDVIATISPTAAKLIPFLIIATIPIFVRVTNPGSKTRDRLTWLLGAAGAGGALGAGADMLLFPLTGVPVGTLVGVLLGGGIGAAAGPKIERGAPIVTQGEAREYLVSKIKYFPDLSLNIISNATEHHPENPKCCVYMFLSDGVIKTTKDEIERWLNSKCWRPPNS